MEPEFIKSEAKIEKSALNRPKWLPDGSQDHFCQEVPPTFTNFWVPSGTQKSTKNRPSDSQNGQFTFFHRFLWCSCFGPIFSPDMGWIFHEKSTFFSSHFSKASLVFFNLATLTKHCYLRIQINFFI